MSVTITSPLNNKNKISGVFRFFQKNITFASSASQWFMPWWCDLYASTRECFRQFWTNFTSNRWNVYKICYFQNLSKKYKRLPSRTAQLTRSNSQAAFGRKFIFVFRSDENIYYFNFLYILEKSDEKQGDIYHATSQNLKVFKRARRFLMNDIIFNFF